MEIFFKFTRTSNKRISLSMYTIPGIFFFNENLIDYNNFYCSAKTTYVYTREQM